MKHLHRTRSMKIICFIMCILMLAMTVASAFGIYGFFRFEAYTKSEQEIFDVLTYDMLENNAYNIIYYVLLPEAYSINYKFPYENTKSNVRYVLISPDEEVVATNVEGAAEKDSSKWKLSFLYEVEGWYDTYPAYPDTSFIISGINPIDRVTEQENVYTLKIYLKENCPIGDNYFYINSIVHIAYALRYWIYVIAALALALFITLFIILMLASAKRPGTEELYPGPLNKVPFDLLLALISLPFITAIYILDLYCHSQTMLIISIALLIAFGVIAFFGICMSISARIKQNNLLKNTLCRMIIVLLWKMLKLIGKGLKWIGKMIKNGAISLFLLVMSIPLIWRTLFAVIVWVALDVLIMNFAFSGKDITVFILIAKDLIFVLTALYGALFMRKLQKGGNALANGDLSYKTDTSIMFWDFKKHAENLNSIADGMAKAVEERLSSERMKAELITNVSHDIKTPLTSIINYASLIHEEECSSKKHKEYSEVLTRKSEHLKRLLDDLVEIAKATTGNLDVNLTPCDAGVLLTQTIGEFEQKCRSAELELVTNQCEEKITIMADSRRIWRVFENLMNNACKYSLPGSRVYLTLVKENNEALFIFRNTSKNILNISPSELIERFVRGDSSRSTEGNGLGLSIAQSLTELQNGTMDVVIDGDLFKVTLKFPII
ncbi:MAG: HAMP domain-containing histidine kinase [Ruminococcaceae bacterium]|nr:HAMP domain-containing histidine kinase [Oscillospiraceae bacterium]